MKSCRSLLPVWTLLLGLCIGFLLAIQRQDSVQTLMSCFGQGSAQSNAAASVVAEGEIKPDSVQSVAAAPEPAIRQADVVAALPASPTTVPEQAQSQPMPGTTVGPVDVQAPTVEAQESVQSEPTTVPELSIYPDSMGVEFRCLDEPFKWERACRNIRPRCKKRPFGPGNTNCPRDNEWLSRIVKADPHPGKIILNIGCNTAIDSIKMLQYFDQRKFWSLRNWEKYSGGDFCHSNPDLPRPPHVDSKEVPRAICVEAVPQTIRKVDRLIKQVGYKEDMHVGLLQTVHAAASDTALAGETVSFVDAPPGYEQGGIGGGNSNAGSIGKFKLVQVPKQTVDGLVDELKLPKVDMLIIDTEGHDPAVLWGAQKTLDKVRYLEFEVHRDVKGTTWENTTVFSVVEMLSRKGFDCYWAGVIGKLVSMTHCFERDRLFEPRGMANAVCVKRRDVWWEVMESLCPGAELASEAT